MKLKSAIFRGLVGVYMGSGLQEITIDFTKCKNRIILITGPNGSGKSTIMDALHPLPDSQSMYLPKMECFKEIEYIMNDGTIYQIHIEYPINKYKERTTTKAFIRKLVDGNFIELNVNGNVGTYKDVIFNEFKLDPNFIALTKLSSENRGLVEKTPAERKKYVGNIISSTEVYNNIFKTLNKRSSIFNSMINSIVAKIDSIGNEDSMKGTLVNLEERIKTLNENRELLYKNLSDAEAIVKLSDPNGDIQAKYLKVCSENQSIMEQIGILEMFISKIKDKDYYLSVKDKETCLNTSDELKTELMDIDIKIETKKEYIKNIFVSREEDALMLKRKEERLSSLNSEYNYNVLKEEINTLEINITKYLDALHSVGLSENSLISKDEFISGMNIIKSIQDQISVIRSYSYEKDIESAVKFIKENYNIIDARNDLQDKLHLMENRLSDVKTEIIKFSNLKDLTEVLTNRPSECTIDSCGFIKNALGAVEQDPDSNLYRLGNEQRNLEKEIKFITDNITELDQISKTISDINVIIRSAQSGNSILNKIPYGNEFSSLDNILSMIKSGGQFERFNDLYSFLDCVNILEMYKCDNEKLIKLKAESKIYETKHGLIDELTNDINELVEKLKNVENLIIDTNKEIKQMEGIRNSKFSLSSVVNDILEKYTILEELKKQKAENDTILLSIDTTMANIENAIKNINSINEELKRIDDEIKPLKEELDKTKYSLDRLQEYNDELSMYRTKYDLVELIKKYSSPTRDGIQNLFIEVYMGQTLNVANSLLQMLFNGELSLLKYIINDKEFKIPCRNSESVLTIDDISSCSTAQKCMISTTLSVALLQQSSPIYNILQLDEMDGGLDAYNRSKFPEFLEQVMSILDMEMCIMVSHASESVLSNTDIICLGAVGNELPNGNIIFTYNDEQNKRVCD